MKNIEFVSGFSLPSEQAKVRALGRDYNTLCTTPEYSNEHQYWQNVPAPIHIDDWLAQYHEEAQSYTKWKSLNKKIFHKRQRANTIYLLQIGSTNSDIKHLPEQVDYLKRTYQGIQVKILPKLKILCQNKRKPLQLIVTYQTSPTETLEWDIEARVAHEYDLHRERKADRQIRVGPILDILSYILPSDALCLCAITMEDLYDGDTDSFVSGMAAGGSHVGVFSFARYTVDSLTDISEAECKGLQLHPNAVRKMRGTRANNIKDSILLRRSCKTLSHEIGHLFSIGHCVYYDCIMNGSGHLKEDFAQSMHFCPVDLRKIQDIIKGGIWERYEGLWEFYNRHKWYGDAAWITKRLEGANRTKDDETETVIELD